MGDCVVTKVVNGHHGRRWPTKPLLQKQLIRVTNATRLLTLFTHARTRNCVYRQCGSDTTHTRCSNPVHAPPLSSESSFDLCGDDYKSLRPFFPLRRNTRTRLGKRLHGQNLPPNIALHTERQRDVEHHTDIPQVSIKASRVFCPFFSGTSSTFTRR
jgi:hypothetical protein